MCLEVLELGTQERKRMVLWKALVALRREAQVEKALRCPPADRIFKVVTTMNM